MHTRYQHLFTLLWALILFLCLGITTFKLIDGAHIDSSILNLLPADEQDPVIESANQSMTDHFNNKVLLLIGSKNASDIELRNTVNKLHEKLKQSKQFTNISTGINSDIKTQLVNFYYPHRYQLLSSAIRQQLQKSQLEQLQKLAINNLYNPVSAPKAASIIEDPFQLLNHWLQDLQKGSGFKADAWGLFAENNGSQYRVLSAEFTGRAFDPENQIRLIDTINMLQQQLSTISTDTGIDYSLHKSGLLFHAAAATKQAQNEISTIGLGSILGIVLLLLWHFRTASSLIAPILSISSGLLVAFTLTLTIFGEIHLVTIAFGAGLVGVSIDYALHYLCAQRYKGNKTLVYILPGITLGLITSVSAYFTQALTPFPGLQQMAVFSAAGLFGAWLTVISCFPLLSARSTQTPSPLFTLMQHLAKHRRSLTVLVFSIVLLGIWGVSTLTFKDDLRTLQKSPQALIADEKLIQMLSRQPSASLFLLVQAPSTEELLQREESIREKLDNLIKQQELQGYLALSQFVPSIDRQKRDFQLIEKNIYQNESTLTTFYRSIGAGQKQVSEAQSFFAKPHQWLTLSDLDSSPLASTLSYLKLPADSINSSSLKYASVISLGKPETSAAYNSLKQWSSQTPGVQLVNRIENISKLLARYRHTAMQWMLLAYTGIAILLTWRYRINVWRILLPPFTGTIVTLGLLSLGGHSINLFHLLASLLILGIGLDMGIFLNESSSEAHSWEAITLSATTSILAFGLLALSDTPVLHYFGITVLIGITIAWLLVFLIGAKTLLPGSIHQSRKGNL